MSHLANSVRVCISEDVRVDRSRTDNSYADVVLKHFGCKRVEIALSTSRHSIHHHYASSSSPSSSSLSLSSLSCSRFRFIIVCYYNMNHNFICDCRQHGWCPEEDDRQAATRHTMLLGTTRVSLPNSISFRSTALAGCTSVYRVVLNRGKYDRGLTQFRRRTLHWLDVADRIRFRLCVQVYKCQHSMAPGYLA